MPNRLIHQKSPYLLQHAHNPVEWYPWGRDAFDAARKLDRPIFLSIGYATCHWCHVMERESFEDASVARLLNEAFINVKVDREERPDIDGVYMTVAQMTTGHGGWPLTVLLTPERRPFFAATYIPRESRHGRIGMLDLVPRIRAAWEGERDALLSSAATILEHLERAVNVDSGGRSLDDATLRQAFTELAGTYDREWGGFGAAPKFPATHRLSFLLRYWRKTGIEQARIMVEETLDAMRMGGIFDQLGWGFHRYSTDRRWLIPHFEKMLYDQAMLMLAYTESFEIDGSPARERTVREIAAYVLGDLRAPEGGFYSAEDADSEGEEGRFYVWSMDELREALGAAELELAASEWGATEEGNHRDEATGELTGLNILHLAGSRPKPPGDPARTGAAGGDRLERVRLKLLARRATRERPLLDDKILTDWNGLTIAALARAGRALGEISFTEAAARAAGFLERTMWREGVLLHRYRDGEAAIEGNLDDYAFLTWGELELHQATRDARHLRRAIGLTDSLLDRFRDDERGGMYFSPAGREDLIVRRKEVHDGAAPSGNSVTLLNLLRLARLTGEPRYEQLAAETAAAFSRRVAAQPSAHAFFLTALDLATGPSQEVVIVGEPGSPDTLALLREADRGFHPERVVLLRPAGVAGDPVSELAPFVRELTTLDGRATAYVCRDFACDRPVTDPAELASLLAAASSEER